MRLLVCMLAVLLCAPSLHAEDPKEPAGLVFRGPDGHPLKLLREGKPVMELGLEAAVLRKDGTQVPLGGAVRSAEDNLVLVSSRPGLLFVFAKQADKWVPLGGGKLTVEAGKPVRIVVGAAAKSSKSLRMVYSDPKHGNDAVAELSAALERREADDVLRAKIEKVHKNLSPSKDEDQDIVIETGTCSFTCASEVSTGKSTYLRFESIGHHCSFDLEL